MCSLRGTHCIFPSLSVCYAASQSLQLANKQEAQMAYRNSFLCWFPPVLFFRPYHQTVLSRVVLGSADCPYLCRRLALRYFPLCLSNSRYYTIKSLHVTKHNLRLLSVGPQNTVIISLTNIKWQYAPFPFIYTAKPNALAVNLFSLYHITFSVTFSEPS